MTPEEAIRANAQLVIDEFSRISPLGKKFGYTRDSLEWVTGFIERQRQRTDAEKESRQSRLTEIIGSYLGECLVQVYGGTWRKDKDGQWAVLLKGSVSAYPFTKVNKQFENGVEGGDSILGFFDSCDALIKRAPDLLKSPS